MIGGSGSPTDALTGVIGGRTYGTIAPVCPITMGEAASVEADDGLGVAISAEAEDGAFADVSAEFASLSEDSGGVFSIDDCGRLLSTIMKESSLPKLCEGALTR